MYRDIKTFTDFVSLRNYINENPGSEFHLFCIEKFDYKGLVKTRAYCLGSKWHGLFIWNNLYGSMDIRLYQYDEIVEGYLWVDL